MLHYKPNIKWTRDRRKEPDRPKAEHLWFWNLHEKTVDFMRGKASDGNRWNDCCYINRTKKAARQETKI